MADSENEDRSTIIAHFQEITGVEDDVESVQALSAHSWNLEAAVQASLNQRDPPPPPLHPPNPPPPPPLSSHHPLPTSPPAHPHISQGTGAVIQVHRGRDWWQWLSSLALFPLRFIVNTATEVLSFIVQLVFGSQPRPATNPRGDVASFLTDFETLYGNTHPDFLQCSYAEALTDARQQLRFLMVYLHSPQHQDTPHFCRSVLASREFSDFAMAQSLLVWAVGVDTEEGARVSHIFRENTFPFLVLVGLRGGRMCVCERLEGRVERGQVERRVQRAIQGHEAEMVAERTERQRRNSDKQLREEQDRAYAVSLEADQAKKREREQQLAEQEQRVATERERVEREQRKEEEFAAELHMRRSRLPPEPAPSQTNTMLISLRLPSGERMERKFCHTDSLQSLYDFAYTSDSVPRRFTLVTNFPRKELHCSSDGGPELAELSLGPKCVLFIQNDSD